MSTIDFSQPLATLLSESTRQAHEKTEKSYGATAMVSGELSKDEYIRQLMMLWFIYESVPPLNLRRISLNFIASAVHSNELLTATQHTHR